MKKIAKLSLVAAMAVTAANAAALEEAIKNVDVSGKVYVETIANTDQTANGSTDTLTDIEVDVTVKAKVNDNVTAVVRAQADNTSTEDVEDAKIAGDQNVSIDNVYFSYANGGLTVNTGKQDINTPNTDGENGNGVLALYNAGFATFAAAHYISSEISKNDVSAVAALGSFGPVNAEAWYVRLNGDSDHYTFVASTKLAGVNLGARHAISEADAAGSNDASTTKITASANFGAFGLNAAFVSTDKDGAATVTDASSANTYELSQLGLVDDDTKITDLEVADATIWAVGASYTMDAMKYQVDYADFESDLSTSGDITEADELRFRATYTMSKNFKVMGTYSIYEGSREDNTKVENNSARLEAKYSF
jgi:hypothetical protein